MKPPESWSSGGWTTRTEKRTAFYRSLPKPVRVGIEATGPIHWFERLLAELGHELWIGDSAKIRASEVRKQKTDERDARLILELLLANRFPRIWVPTPAERDLRQLLWHRHKLVCLRTMLGNQLHVLAMSQGLCRKKKLFTQKGRGELEGWRWGHGPADAAKNFCGLLDQLDPPIAELDRAVLEEAKRREDAVRLMTHPGIGPVNALAFVLTIGPIARFRRSKKIASYLGLNPSEHLQRRTTAARSHQQTGQHHGALAADRSGTSRGAFRSRTAAGLSAVEVPPRTRGGEGGHRAQVGCAYVLDAAQWGRLRTAGSHARQPGGHPGGREFIARLIGRLAPPSDRGV